MQTGVIVRRNPDQFIPNEFIELALKNNPSAYGAAIIDGAEGLKTSSGGKDELTVDFVKETMEAFPNRAITFYFCNSDGAVNDADLFPQILLSDGDTPRLAVFVDANMPGFVKKDSSRGAESHFVEDWLLPKFNDIAELVDGDLDKIMAYCSKDSFRKDVLQNAVSRGAITLVSEKTALTFATGDTCKEYPWGWTSNHYGFEMQTEKKEDTPPVKKNMFAKRSTVREPAASAGPIVDQTGTPVSKVAAQIAGSTSIRPQYSVKKGRPEGNLSRKNKKKWYEIRIGYYPQGGDKSAEIEYYVDQTGKLLAWGQVKKLGLDAVGLPKLNNPARINAQQEQEIENEKDTDPHTVEGNDLQNQPQPKVSSEILPILPPQTRDHILKAMGTDEVKKIISESGDIVATAEQAKAMEAKFADFTKQLGDKYSIQDFMKMPYEWLYKLGSEKPAGLAILAWTFKNMLVARMAKEATKAAAAPVVEEKVEAPAPKKNMFAKKVA